MTSPLDSYFDGLDRGDNDAAAAAFAPDAVYMRPSLGTDGARTLDVIRGRGRILEFFERRGTMPHRHEVRSSLVKGPDCFVEAAMVTPTGLSGVFVAHATLDRDGLITRYLALMAEPPADGDALGGGRA